MNTSGQSRFRVLSRLVCCLLSCLFLHSISSAQGVRIDHFTDLKTDDAMARLDAFANHLKNHQSQIGLLVAYRSDSTLHGPLLRLLGGYRRYLVQSRGVASEQLRLIDGGIRSGAGSYSFEFWLTPEVSQFSEPEESRVLKPVQFDGMLVGGPCDDGFYLELDQLTDALKFYAAALKNHPEAKGLIFIKPSSDRSLKAARNLISTAKVQLERTYNLPPHIIVSLPQQQVCHSVDFWLLPSNFIFPAVADMEAALWAQLLAEAESNQFTIGRVTFWGNDWGFPNNGHRLIREDILRSKITGLHEGAVFSRELLRTNLTSVSRLNSIYKIRPLDVIDVHLDHNRKTIDFTILVRPKPRGRR